MSDGINNRLLSGINMNLNELIMSPDQYKYFIELLNANRSRLYYGRKW
jgi:hypothetical protein